MTLDCYPFGLKQKGYNDVVNGGNDLAQNWKYNGKELNEELGLNWYDYGARNYDASLGRWMNIDPLAEKYFEYSSYNYTLNNPIIFTDPDGMVVEFAENLSKEDRELLGSAIYHLRKNSKTFDKAFSELHSSDLVFTVGDVASGEGPWGLFIRPTEILEGGEEDEDGMISDLSISYDMSSGKSGGNILANLSLYRELQREGLDVDPEKETLTTLPEEFAGAALFLYYFGKTNGQLEGTPGAANIEFETKMISGIVKQEANLGYGKGESQIFAESFGVRYLKKETSDKMYSNALKGWLSNPKTDKFYRNLEVNDATPEYTKKLKK